MHDYFHNRTALGAIPQLKPVVPSSSPALLLDPSLVSYWKLNGNSLDSKGTNHGVDTSMVYGTQYGVTGQGSHFASGSRIKLPNNVFHYEYANPVTIVARIRFTVDVNTNCTILHHAVGNSSYWGLHGWRFWAIRNVTGDLKKNLLFQHGPSDSQDSIAEANYPFALNTWYEVGVSKGAGGPNTWIFYVNGIAQTTTLTVFKSTAALETSVEETHLGYFTWGIPNDTPTYWDGDMDRVAVFSRILTAQEHSDWSNAPGE